MICGDFLMSWAYGFGPFLHLVVKWGFSRKFYSQSAFIWWNMQAISCLTICSLAYTYEWMPWSSEKKRVCHCEEDRLTLCVHAICSHFLLIHAMIHVLWNLEFTCLHSNVQIWKLCMIKILRQLFKGISSVCSRVLYLVC